MKKTKDLRSKKPEELDAQLIELRKELIKLNSQVATGTSVKSPGDLKKIKKNIARILTIKKENE